MIDPHDVIQPEAVIDSPLPPGKVCLFMVTPVVKRIAPKLSVRRKCIRRTARNSLRSSVLIHLKHLRMCPEIRAVRRHIDRNVPDDLNAVIIGILFEAVPLGCKHILEETVETDLLTVCLLCLPERLRIPFSQLKRPFLKAFSIVCVLDRHEQRIVRKPVLVLREELLVARCLVKAASPAGKLQDREAVCIELVIVNLRLVSLPEINGLHLALLQKPFFNQSVQVNKVRITCKSREGLVGRVPVSGRTQREDLPVMLAGSFQLVNNLTGTL